MLRRLVGLLTRCFRRRTAAPPASFSAMQAEARTRNKAAAVPGEFLQAHGWLPCEPSAAPAPAVARSAAVAAVRRLLS